MRIQRGTTNQVPVTVTELTTIATPYYLFEFIGATKTPLYVICSVNLSDETQRYDKFEIIEAATLPDPVTHRITLAEGDYTYNVYEQASSTNINPTGLTKVETGICTVFDDATNVNLEYSGGVRTNLIYNG